MLWNMVTSTLFHPGSSQDALACHRPFTKRRNETRRHGSDPVLAGVRAALQSALIWGRLKSRSSSTTHQYSVCNNSAAVIRPMLGSLSAVVFVDTAAARVWHQAKNLQEDGLKATKATRILKPGFHQRPSASGVSSLRSRVHIGADRQAPKRASSACRDVVPFITCMYRLVPASAFWIFI
jgi:hypothetical protein